MIYSSRFPVILQSLKPVYLRKFSGKFSGKLLTALSHGIKRCAIWDVLSEKQRKMRWKILSSAKCISYTRDKVQQFPT